MLKWTKEILLTLAKKVNAKQAFLLLGMTIFFTGGYFVLDRGLDYREAVDLNKPKRIIEKSISTIPDYVLHKDKVKSGGRADNIQKK